MNVELPGGGGDGGGPFDFIVSKSPNPWDLRHGFSLAELILKTEDFGSGLLAWQFKRIWLYYDEVRFSLEDVPQMSGCRMRADVYKWSGLFCQTLGFYMREFRTQADEAGLSSYHREV